MGHNQKSCAAKNFTFHYKYLKAHRQKSKKRCFEKYYLYNQVCQFSAL